MVKFLQPHNFRLSALLPPREAARYAVHGTQQHSGAAAAAKASSPAGSTTAGSKAGSTAAATERLPLVPEFYSFTSAVKQDPRLLLRHDDLALTTAGASEAADSSYSLAAGWEAVRGAALGSPSCLLRSLAFLFCGSNTLAAGCWGPAPGRPLAQHPALQQQQPALLRCIRHPRRQPPPPPHHQPARLRQQVLQPVQRQAQRQALGLPQHGGRCRANGPWLWVISWPAGAAAASPAPPAAVALGSARRLERKRWRMLSPLLRCCPCRPAAAAAVGTRVASAHRLPHLPAAIAQGSRQQTAATC